jgi:hypothetical protein
MNEKRNKIKNGSDVQSWKESKQKKGGKKREKMMKMMIRKRGGKINSFEHLLLPHRAIHLWPQLSSFHLLVVSTSSTLL